MLEGKKVKLRGFEKNDLEETHKAMNNPNMTRYLSVYFRPHSKEEEEEWIEKTWEKRQKGQEYTFAVEEKTSEELIGSVSLLSIKQKDKRAELGIWIKEDYWGKGYGTEAEELMVKYGFEELNLHSIYARAFDFNERSQKAIEKVGFKKVGKQRESLYRNGRYCDTLYYDMLKEEWEKKQN